MSVMLRDDVDELLGRLERLRAASVTLSEVAMRPPADGGGDRSLAALLDDLERDLLLASRDVARVRAHGGG